MKDLKVYQTSGMLNFLQSEAADVRKKEETISGAIVTFNADTQFPIKIAVDIDSIAGVTGASIWVKDNYDPTLPATISVIFNKNLCNPDDVAEVNSSATRIRMGVYLTTAGTFTVSAKHETNSSDIIYARVKDSGGTYGTASVIADRNTKTAKTYTLSAGDTLVVYDGAVNTEERVEQLFKDTELQIEAGSYESEYEPYIGTVFSGKLSIGYDGSVILKTGGKTYTLTSITTIESLVGDNNIWADAGEVSVTYQI